MSDGPWVTLGHALLPPQPPYEEFGPPLFTPEQQEQYPHMPYTRVVKDVLQTGKWSVFNHATKEKFEWEVKPDTLNLILESHNLATSNGVAANLGKSHGNLDTWIIPTDELIAPIDKVVVSDGVLWVSAYVTPEQAKYLSNPAMKVSPGVLTNWTDGKGTVYPLRLVHVAVTDNPVVTGQGPFLALTNVNKGSSDMKSLFASLSSVVMAEEEETGGGGSTPETGEITDEGTDLSVEGAGTDRLIELVNGLLPEGVFLPESTTGENLVHNLEVVVATIVGLDTGTDGGSTDVSVPADPMEVPLSNLSRTLQQQKAPAWALTLANAVDRIGTRDRQTAQQAFEARLTDLGKAGVSGKVLSQKKALGEKYGWDLGLLEGIGPTVAMGNESRQLGTTDPPDISRGRKKGRPTAADCSAVAGAILARRGIRRNASKAT